MGVYSKFGTDKINASILSLILSTLTPLMFATWIMKLSSQNRALYCYLILSVWIFLLVAGMYKYVGNEEAVSSAFKHALNDVPLRIYPKSSKPSLKMKKIYKFCNPPEDIVLGGEGHIKDDYSLEGVLIFLRHGDRGPLAHVRNISNVNCGGDIVNNDNLDSEISFHSYEYFLQNMSSPGRAASFLPQFLGSFHGFPLIPPSSGECQLGQMTPVGVAQLLKIGNLLKSVYGERLGIGNGTLTTEDMPVYSTRYRRTFQSAVAFLYAFLSFEDFQKVTIYESQSLAFCFNDCACPSAEKYRKLFSMESSEHFHSHPAVVQLVKMAATVVFEMPDKSLSSDPHALRDALLAYVCHGAQLPCTDMGAPDKSPQETCVRIEQVTGLFAYTDWEARQYTKSSNLRRSCLLRSYGLLRDIVSRMLRIISEKKPKFVLYSGHDKTLQYLTTALGLISDMTVTPQYASRLILEVYKSRVQIPSSESDSGLMARNYFFRLLFNGRDLTNRIHFCKGGNSILVNQAQKLNSTETASSGINNVTNQPWSKKVMSAYLCPIESIIRFLHDNYFLSFNATNFKDSCAVHSS